MWYRIERKDAVTAVNSTLDDLSDDVRLGRIYNMALENSVDSIAFNRAKTAIVSTVIAKKHRQCEVDKAMAEMVSVIKASPIVLDAKMAEYIVYGCDKSMTYLHGTAHVIAGEIAKSIVSGENHAIQADAYNSALEQLKDKRAELKQQLNASVMRTTKGATHIVVSKDTFIKMVTLYPELQATACESPKTHGIVPMSTLFHG